MTAAAYSTNLSNIFTDGDTTGWSALGGGASGLNQETDYYIQGTSCLSKNAFASATKGMIYNNGSDAGGSGTDGAYLMWVTHLTPNSLDTISGGGIQMLIGSSSSDYVHYYVGGSDTIEFGGWILAAVNEATAGDQTDTGTPSATVESYFGALWDLPSGGPTKGAPNGIDAIRYGRCDIIITGGTSPDAAANFAGIFTNLETSSNRYGLLVNKDGAYYSSGLLRFGTTGGTACRFTESNKTVFLRDHPHVTSNFHTWEVQNASSEVNLTNMTVQALGTTSRGRWLTTDNATVNFTGCSFTDMGTFGFNTGATINGCTFRRCDAVTHGGADMSNSIITDTNVSANASALVYDVNADPDGEMDNMSFTMGSTATHAIEFGTNVPSTMTIRGVDFSGYGTGNNANDSTFHFKDTIGTITLNLVNCSGNASYRTDGATINIVQDPVTVAVKAVTIDGAGVASARVLLEASGWRGTHTGSNNASVLTDSTANFATNELVGYTIHNFTDPPGSSGTITANTATTITATLTGGTDNDWDTNDVYHINAGPLSGGYQVAIGYTTTTATVTHPSHGLSTGDEVVIRGCAPELLNGIHTIAVTSANVYTYTITSGGSGTATGTPRSWTAMIYGTTDSNGEISASWTLSSNQRVTGWIRKSTSTPFYKSAPLTGTVDSTAGASFTGVMILDE